MNPDQGHAPPPPRCVHRAVRSRRNVSIVHAGLRVAASFLLAAGFLLAASLLLASLPLGCRRMELVEKGVGCVNHSRLWSEEEAHKRAEDLKERLTTGCPVIWRGRAADGAEADAAANAVAAAEDAACDAAAGGKTRGVRWPRKGRKKARKLGGIMRVELEEWHIPEAHTVQESSVSHQ